MSEGITPPQSTPFSPLDIAESLAIEQQGHLVLTHARFALRSNESDFVITSEGNGEQRSRYLILSEGQDEGALYQDIQGAGVRQFDRIAHGKGVAIYQLPMQAKKLSDERLFSGHVSSETYVSDIELFTELGKLWSKIYKATEKTPAINPLSETALLDFGQEDSRLIPIPPYTKWEHVSSSALAKEHLAQGLHEQLLHINPRQSYRTLLDAFNHGWHRED